MLDFEIIWIKINWKDYNFDSKKAFSEHDHSGQHHDDSHNEGVYKGLGAITGIYVFFLIEKIMQMRRARKEKRVK